MNNPVALGFTQIGAFTAIYDHNARPTQAMNNREFLVGPQTEEPDTLPETGGTAGWMWTRKCRMSWAVTSPSVSTCLSWHQRMNTESFAV